MRQEMTRANNANRKARRLLQRILEENPGPLQTAQLIANISAALSENLDALQEVERIVSGAPMGMIETE